MIGRLWRALSASGRFLWSFFVDDTPEVPVIVAMIVGAAYGLRHHNTLAVVVVPTLAIAGLCFCVWRACRSRAGGPDEGPLQS